MIRTKILPYFGQRKIGEIEAKNIIAWQNELLAYKGDKGERYSPTYLKTIHSQLSAIFNHAVHFYHLPFNPAQRAGTMGSEEHKEMLFWTKEEYLKFADAMMVLIGVPETQIIQVKHIGISKQAKELFRKVGNQPQLFITIIWLAITVLEHLITQIFKLVYQSAGREKEQRQEPIVTESQQVAIQENTQISNMESGMGLEVSKSTSLPIPEKPKRTLLAERYSRLSEIYEKLES